MLSRGLFGGRAVAIKGSVALLTVVAQHRILRHGHANVSPDLVTGYRPLAIVNFAAGLLYQVSLFATGDLRIGSSSRTR